MRRKEEKIGQVGRSYKNSGRINRNQHQTDGHHRGNDGRWQPDTRQFQGYKTNEARKWVLQSKGFFHVREMVDATIADRDKGHETG